MKELRFIHISKTAGQSIAVCAMEQEKRGWGMFDINYGPRLACHRLVSKNMMCIPRDTYDWFMVVRNPYERMVSEYNWLLERDSINVFLNKHFDKVEAGKTNEGDHFTEQWRYMEDGLTIHVLRYETLEHDFHELMKKYGHNIKLNTFVNVRKDTATLKDLTLETIERINRIYEKDFKMFGYEMVHTTF